MKNFTLVSYIIIIVPINKISVFHDFPVYLNKHIIFILKIILVIYNTKFMTLVILF